LGACSSGIHDENYKLAVRNTWRHTDSQISGNLLVKHELVRYAAMAPSSHNTQYWKFRVEDRSILILPDLLRQCPAVDPDNHHLFVSLGCAAENLIQAALANGLKGEALLDTTTANGIRVVLEPAKAIVSALFRSIPDRQSTRAEFDGKSLTPVEMRLLEQAGTGDGVHMIFLTEKSALEKILGYVIEGNSAQMNNPAFVKELKTWIRFNGDEAVRTGDGLYSGTTGNPSLPSWLGRLLFGMFFTQKGENDKYARQIRSSAGVALFVSEVNDMAHWVEVGRCYERFALQSASLGIRNAMVNQTVEVSSLRLQLAAYLGVGSQRPDLVVRFGRGPKRTQSLRRPIQDVLV
jgi:hypothetical protein